MNFLETKRLDLQKITLSDAPFYLKLLNSKGWMKYIGDRNVRSVEDAEAYIKKNYLPSYEKFGYGSFTVRLKETGEVIGVCGLYKRDGLDHPDIGFAFLQEYTGRGFGYESASSVLEYAEKDLGIQKILGFTVQTNVASIKLLKKLGMQLSGSYRFAEDSEDLILFSN